MSRPISFDLVTIPRWTIQREALPPACPDCGSMIVRVRADQRQVFFCVCRVVADEFVPRRKSVKREEEAFSKQFSVGSSGNGERNTDHRQLFFLLNHCRRLHSIEIFCTVVPHERGA